MQEVIDFFKEKPYAKRMGAKAIEDRFGVSQYKIKKFRQELKRSKHDILILDIETSPLSAYVWSRWKQNVYLEQTISEWFMLTWSAKWLHDDKVYSAAVTREEVLREDDKRIVEQL